MKLKKTLAIFTLALVCAATLLGAAPLGRVAKAQSIQNKYLLSPTHLATADQNTFFTFDSATNQIKAASQNTITATASQAGVLGLSAHANNVFVLLQNSIAIYSFSTIDGQQTLTLVPTNVQESAEQQPTTTPFQSSSTYLSFSIQNTAENQYLAFIAASSQNNLEIHVLNLTYFPSLNTWGVFNSGTKYNSSELPAQNQPQEQITQIAVQPTQSGSHNILCASQSALYKLQTGATITFEKINDATNPIISTHQNGFAVIQNTTLTVLNDAFQATTPQQLTQQPTCIFGTTTGLFSSNQQTATLNQILPQQNIIYQNGQTIPTNPNTLNNVAYLTTNQTTTLYQYPYSISGQTIPQNTDLVVLEGSNAAHEGMAYITYISNNQNQYGFVNLSHTTSKQANNQTKTVRTYVQTSLHILPSHITDQTNTITAEVQKGEILTVQNDAAQIINGQHSYYYVKTNSGKEGFIEIGKVGTIITQSRQKANTNATIKSQTILYETNKGTGPIIIVPASARVKIIGRLKPNSAYTKVQIQDNNGQTYTGYIKTSLINPDDLTTLQIIGIVLLVLNLFILVLIWAFYHYNKSQPTKSPLAK